MLSTLWRPRTRVLFPVLYSLPSGSHDYILGMPKLEYLIRLSKECDIAILTEFAKFSYVLIAHVHTVYYSIIAVVKISACVNAAVSPWEDESP